MEINFKGPVMPVDPYSQMAFVEILNILLTAGHIVDVNRFLINRNVIIILFIELLFRFYMQIISFLY